MYSALERIFARAYNVDPKGTENDILWLCTESSPSRLHEELIYEELSFLEKEIAKLQQSLGGIKALKLSTNKLKSMSSATTSMNISLNKIATLLKSIEDPKSVSFLDLEQLLVKLKAHFVYLYEDSLENSSRDAKKYPALKVVPKGKTSFLKEVSSKKRSE